MTETFSPRAEVVRGRKDVSEELTALHDRHALIKRGKITPHEVSTKTNTRPMNVNISLWLIKCCFSV